MAFLNARRMGGAAFVGAALSGCSWMYEVESLQATWQAGDGGDVREVVDTAPADDGTLSDGAMDLSAPDDTADTTDTGEPADADAVEDAEMPDDTTTPTPRLALRHTGQAGCTLDYYLQALTNCPKTCGWSFVIDTAGSTGVSTLQWRFSVTGGYTVGPGSANGPNPTVSVGTPSCSLFGGESVGPASLLVEASVNGGPMEMRAKVDFAVRLVSQCPTTPQADCQHPP